MRRVATVLATVLGTLAALGLPRARVPGKSLLMALLISPMIVPLVIVARRRLFLLCAARPDRQPARADAGARGAGAPFVVITVLGDAAGLRSTTCRGRRPASARRRSWSFLRITLPLILPGVISGALFAFVTSFDEVVVALLMPARQRTLPRQMFDGIRENISRDHRGGDAADRDLAHVDGVRRMAAAAKRAPGDQWIARRRKNATE